MSCKDEERIERCFVIQKKIIDTVKDDDKEEALSSLKTLLICNYLGSKEGFLNEMSQHWDMIVEEWSK